MRRVDTVRGDPVGVAPTDADARNDGAVSDQEDREPMWRRLLSIAFTIAVLAFTVYLWPAILGGSTRLIIVSGHSMEPTYDLRDIVVMRDAPDTRVGDVVVFEVPEGRAEGMLIIHRVLEVDDDGFFITQGDNRTTPDQWQLTEEDIVGRPLFHIPQGGKALGFIQNIWVIALLVGMVVLFMLWPDVDDDDAEQGDVEEFRLPVAPVTASRYAEQAVVRCPCDGSLDQSCLDETDALDRVELEVAAALTTTTDDELARRWLESALDAPVDADACRVVDCPADGFDEDAMADAIAWLDEQLAGFEQPVAH